MKRKIKNFKSLGIDWRRKMVLEILESGLRAIDTSYVINKNIKLKNNFLIVKKKKFSLKNFRNIYLIAVGKCALEGALALEKILRSRLKNGIVLTNAYGEKAKKIKTKLRIYFGSHPYPSVINFKASLEIFRLVSSLKENDFVIFLISGGGSTLLSLPISQKIQDLIKEKQLLKELFKRGADIEEINIIRKHLSLVRGGFLSYLSHPAKGVALIFSDVPGDILEIISSGPTVFDGSTIYDVQKVIQKYKLKNVTSSLTLIETPKDRKYFSCIKNMLLVGVNDALLAMKKRGKSFGLRVIIKNKSIQGEARKIGSMILKEGKRAKKNTLLLYGGETTVLVKGKGRGGRNQELVLSALNSIKSDDILILSCASDGMDNGPFAGAICDIITKRKAETMGLNIEKFLEENNSYSFFEKTGDYILTGKTGSNVSDIIMVLKS